MKLGRKTYQRFRLWMLSGGHDPDEGYTFTRQGEESTTHILIEQETTLADSVIICIH